MWYSQGTVSVTNGGTNVTGTGTSWLTNARVGDGITITGSTALHEVIGVASNTQLSIRPAYSGSSGSGKTYGISPLLGYDKDLSDAFNQLRLQFGDELSNLQPWATASSAGQARSALGLGAAATRGTVGGSGDLLVQGAFGLGSYGSEAGSSNYLDPNIPIVSQANGFRAIDSTNYPVGMPEELQSAWASVLLNKRSSTTGAGILQSISNDVFFFRVGEGGVDKVYQAITTKNVLGTVSQSGGVPTGAIIEQGSNANGEYTKFADGTMICTRDAIHDISLSVNQTYDYPHSFISNPQGGVSLQEFGSSTIEDWIDSKTTGYARSVDVWSVRSVSSPTKGTTTCSIGLFAIGRWY